MLSVSAAQELVLQNTRRRAPERISLSPDLLGLILAEDVASDLDVPPFDKALMDGYAVRSADCKPDVVLSVVEEIPAGHTPTKVVGSGQSARIMTGAMIPGGADAVVMIERTDLRADGRVCIHEPPKRVGQNILNQGREMQCGEVVLRSEMRLRPQELGTLATVGCTRVLVYRRPTVAVVPTGDEIVEPHEKPSSGQIRNSNAAMLQGQIARAGALPKYLGIARDNHESLQRLITEGVSRDVLVLSGGVSAGKLDLVPGVLQELGVTPIFHKIAMKPGKPLFFGVKGETLVFGLPGNPVSSFVGFELFVRPALRFMMGNADAGTKLLSARLACDFAYATDRPTYHLARLELTKDGWRVTPVPWFGSADLRAISAASSFVLFNSGENVYHEGDAVEVLAPEL